MPIYYKNQSKVEALSRKTGNTSYRLSEQTQILYGNRGKNRSGDELVYLNNQNTDAPGVNVHLSDAWVKFATGHNGTSKRADQAEREFYQQGNYP